MSNSITPSQGQSQTVAQPGNRLEFKKVFPNGLPLVESLPKSRSLRPVAIAINLWKLSLEVQQGSERLLMECTKDMASLKVRNKATIVRFLQASGAAGHYKDRKKALTDPDYYVDTTDKEISIIKSVWHQHVGKLLDGDVFFDEAFAVCASQKFNLYTPSADSLMWFHKEVRSVLRKGSYISVEATDKTLQEALALYECIRSYYNDLEDRLLEKGYLIDKKKERGTPETDEQIVSEKKQFSMWEKEYLKLGYEFWRKDHSTPKPRRFWWLSPPSPEEIRIVVISIIGLVVVIFLLLLINK